MVRFLATVVALSCLCASLGWAQRAHAQPNAGTTGTVLGAEAAAWKVVVSDGVALSLHADTGPGGTPCLRIDYDFTRGAGYGGASLPLALDLPPNYELNLVVRGTGPANNFEIKLADESGLNVWWVNRRGYMPPAEWTRLVNKRRHFRFAWGPDSTPLARAGHVELVLAASEGGKGSLWVAGLTLRSIPPSVPYTGTPTATATSAADASHAAPGVLATAQDACPGWAPAAGDAAPALTIDFGSHREIGGVVLHWPLGAGTAAASPAEANLTSATIQASDDGIGWSELRVLRISGTGQNAIALPDLETRYLRVVVAPNSPGIRRVEVLAPAAGASPNALWAELAPRAPRGHFPRSMLGEQSYWTVVGLPGDDREALINEEGQIEVDKRSFSIEPFLLVDGQLLTWADGMHEQSLRDGWIPMPTVVRTHAAQGIEMRIGAFVAGTPGDANLFPSYTIKNTGTAVRRGRLALAIRPVQVLPPWQDLNIAGGITPVRTVALTEQGVSINGTKVILPAQLCEVAAATADDCGGADIVALLARGTVPTTREATCPQAGASGVVVLDWELKPGESARYWLVVPMHGSARPKDKAMLPIAAEGFERLAASTAVTWRTAVNRVRIDVPAAGQGFMNTLLAQQAYILINHDRVAGNTGGGDGGGFQPGSRTYERSWIRDGAMTSAAMLELGHTQLVKDFIDWYAPFQFDSGKVPCVVDRRGPDPVPEHDSHGQLIWAIANTHRFTGDLELVKRHYGRVRKAVEFIESLRAQRLTPEFSATGPARTEPGKPPVPAAAFRGLVPESISHEGYSAKPMHSYWDTLFILRGLKDAAYLAGIVGETGDATKWDALAKDMRTSIVESVRLVQQAHGIDYLPGCVELGDFDSTSSTIVAWPVDEASAFPRAWVDATFDRYWKEFTTRRDRTPPVWEAYTPYELRHVGAYLRLGRKDRAWEVLDWLMQHQRPAGWHHWAEVVWREPNMPRMIGDMPHTWCGSDFLNAARAMFVYEDEAAQQLVVFAGIPDAWVSDPAGVGFRALPTEFGPLTASMKPTGPGTITVRVEGAAGDAAASTPVPRGVWVALPGMKDGRPLNGARHNSQPLKIEPGNRVLVEGLPATIEASY